MPLGCRAPFGALVTGEHWDTKHQVAWSRKCFDPCPDTLCAESCRSWLDKRIRIAPTTSDRISLVACDLVVPELASSSGCCGV